MDSHRAKLLNPRWVLVELLQVLTDWHHGKIKAFEKTIKPVIFECLKIIKDDHILEFKPVDPKYYKELLRSTTDKNYHLLLFATKILIDENQNFSEKLFSGIEAEINRLNTEELEVAKLKTLSKYLGYIATELINQGYSKGYLYSITSRIFSEGSMYRLNYVPPYRVKSVPLADSKCRLFKSSVNAWISMPDKT